METRKVFRAADIGREFLSYAFKTEFIIYLAAFILSWNIEEHDGGSMAIFVIVWLQYYTISNLIFNLINRKKKYDKQEKIAAIVDFLPMTKKERNLSNFLINYRKSINILIPYIIICFSNVQKVNQRGLLILNFIVIIWSEGIRNIFMNSGNAEKRRRSILLCEIIPVIFVIPTSFISFIYRPKVIMYTTGNLYIGIALGVLSFAFMFYTAVKYKEVLNN